MASLMDLARTVWFLARTGHRFRRALETPLMLEAGATPGLAYYGMISLWMDSTGVDLTELWERKAFEFFGLLSEYCMKIDRFADSPEGGQQYLANPKLWKIHPDFRPFVHAFACRLMDRGLSRPIRRELAHAIQSYRYTAAESLHQALQAGPLADPDFVLAHKEATSSAAFVTCIELLSIAHAIADPHRQQLRTAFSSWGMCLQISDDLSDLAQDYEKVQNIVASILINHPQEQARLAAAGFQSSKIPTLAPKTFARVEQLFEQYLERVQSSGLQERSVRELHSLARGLFWLGTARVSPRIFRGFVKRLLRMLGSRKWRTVEAGKQPAQTI